MQRNRAFTFLVLASLFASVAFGAEQARIRAMQENAKTDNYRVWIHSLKGFGGDVFYLGSDDTHVYFRIGRVFRSYYKVPSCAVRPPETFSLLERESYPVKLHIDASNRHHAETSCSQPVDYPLGDLDRA